MRQQDIYIYICHRDLRLINIIDKASNIVFWWESYGVQHNCGLVQERRNSIANALELRLSCTNPSILWLLCRKLNVLWWDSFVM